MKNIGIIGAGSWSAPYARAAKAAGLNVTGIYTPNSSAVALAHDVDTVANEDPKVLMKKCDCVLIGSPTDTHVDYLKMAGEIGVPVLCASPVVEKAAEIERALGAGAKGWASFPYRTRPEFARLKQAISGGDLGTVGMIRLGFCRPKPSGWRAEHERSGGILFELGSHALDTLLWLGGPLERIHCAGNSAGGREYALMVAKMADGAVAHIELSWAEAPNVSYDYYEVAGSDGLLDYDTRREPLMVVDYVDNRANEVISPGASVAHFELLALKDALEGRDSALASLEDGLEICRKLELMSV